jgi:predicted ATPase
MITGVGFKNFKCFGSEVQMPAAQINLLTGINGRGKSTVLQGLLLMRQSPEHSRTTERIIFNGACVELGSFDDIRNSDVSRQEPVELSFEFGCEKNSARLEYILEENVNDDMVAQIQEVNITGTVDDHQYRIQVYPSQNFHRHDGKRYEMTWRNLIFGRLDQLGEPLRFVSNVVNFTRIHYVSADRVGPRDFYAKQTFTEFPSVGRNGEFTANVLFKKGQDLVHEALSLASSSTNTVADQTEAWLARVFEGGRVSVRPTEANIVILRLNSQNTLKGYKPSNVGFGYSYALPIIVSGLIIKPGEVLIVENPEAHLHPYAQSQIARFLAKVSTAGAQVFIESHSDHILNGLRLGIKDGVLNDKDVNILYFDRSPNLKITRIQVERDGSIRTWPEGFFDQSNVEFSRLLST